MKIALAGYGIEGRSSLAYYQSQGDVVIADERSEIAGLPAGVPTILGPDAFSKLTNFDLIIRSPSINPKKLPYADKVWSATNEFFEKCTAPIIGVTGTKGKGTTASLVASILRAAGRTTHLVGNIGVPALDELSKITADDIVVFELSSFQLWDARKSPHVAVITMIEPDHLDIHDSLQDYIDAKSNIVKFQTSDDIVIYPSSVDDIEKRMAKQSAGTMIPFLYSTGTYCIENFFWYQEEKICSTDNLKLPGGHNFANACAAIAAAWQYTKDKDAFATGLSSFHGLPHRLKFVAEKNGVRYYDDSIATTPGSAIAALRSFDLPIHIILGGSDKGTNYRELVKLCHETDSRVIAVGQTGAIIAGLCRERGVPVKEMGNSSMEEVVKEASTHAEPGSIVILSPASASFDMYRNYAERGEQFIAAVERLGSR